MSERWLGVGLKQLCLRGKGGSWVLIHGDDTIRYDTIADAIWTCLVAGLCSAGPSVCNLSLRQSTHVTWTLWAPTVLSTSTNLATKRVPFLVWNQIKSTGHLRRSKAWVDFLEGHKNCWDGGSRGVYLIPYTDRFHELKIFGAPLGGTPSWRPEIENQISDSFCCVALKPTTQQHFEYCLNNWTA